MSEAKRESGRPSIGVKPRSIKLTDGQWDYCCRQKGGGGFFIRNLVDQAIDDHIEKHGVNMHDVPMRLVEEDRKKGEKA